MQNCRFLYEGFYCIHKIKLQGYIYDRFSVLYLTYNLIIQIHKSKDEDDDKKRHFVAFGYFDNPVTLKRYLTVHDQRKFDSPVEQKIN